MDTLWFHYKFIFPDKTVKEFKVDLDQERLDLIQKERDSIPEWTKLENYKCENCTLDSGNTHCPVAVNLIDIIDFFKELVSCDIVEVEITTPQRTYSRETTIQQGLSSLVGIYMVTSGCPVMDRLRPMVRTHLPFATIPETTYRVISMFLLSQYFLHKKGESPDWNLDALVKIYQEIQTVNQWLFKRISSMKISDAALNAIIRLDSFAQFTNMVLLRKRVDEMEKLFQAYSRSGV